MSFPKFAIRDMVESQYRLLKEKFGIDHVVAVVGPSMRHAGAAVGRELS